MADTQELIGQQIGEYFLQRQLGRGTFGVVYLAEHIDDQSLVAVKLLRLQLTRSLELKDFLNEARIIRLRHPHIVPILDFGISSDDMPFIVMEYAAGGSLRDRFWHGSILPLPEIVTYTNQLATALQFAHSRRLIHRDIKPENMLLRADDTVLLCDFGIAKIMEQSATMSVHAQAGTPAYMAPEQTQGSPCLASDQYALAVVVYEWVTGRRPFLGTPIEVAVQHQLNPPPPLRVLRPGLPPEAEQVILKALSKAPEDRFETVEQFAQALQLAIDGWPTEKVPIVKRSAPLPERATHTLSKPNPARPTPLPVEQMETIVPVTPPPGKNALDRDTPPPSVALAPSQTQLRRWIIPKRRQVLPSILALLIIVACVLSYFAFLAPPSTAPSTSAQSGPSSYDKAVATTGVMFGSNAEHTGDNPYEQILSASTIDRLAARWEVSTGSLLVSSPVVANGLIYIGSNVGLSSRLSALDAVSHQIRWTASVGGSITLSTPAIANGLVYIGSNDGKLYAFDALSGTFKWASPTGSPIESAPTIANGLIYIGNDGGQLSAFDALKGSRKWVAQTDVAAQTNRPAAITTSPAVAAAYELVYIGASNSKLYAFDALSGTRQWATPTLGNDFTFSSPAIANGLVYVSSQDTILSHENRLYAFSALDGLKQWETPAFTSTLSSPVIANNLVYVVSQDGQLLAFDASLGLKQWSVKIGNSSTAAPAIANDLIYTGSDDGKLLIFSAPTGKQVWDATINGSIESSPTIANGVLYVSSHSGQLYSFALA